MKNFLKVLRKSLIGIPVAIFLYEILNLIISIIMKQYVKIDEFNLHQLIIDYIEYGLIGYGLAFIMKYMEYFIKKSDKNEIQKTKELVTVFGVVIIIIILVNSIIETDMMIIGLAMIAMISLLMCVLLFIIFLFDKKEVNNINKKIKENQEKKD